MNEIKPKLHHHAVILQIMIQHMTLTMTTTSIMSHVSLKHYESLLNLFFSATRDYCYVRFWICSLFFQIQMLRLLVSTSSIISQPALLYMEQ